MREKIRPVTPILVVFLPLILSFSATSGFAQAAMTTSVDGTVASVNSTTLSLTTPDGTTVGCPQSRYLGPGKARRDT